MSIADAVKDFIEITSGTHYKQLKAREDRYLGTNIRPFSSPELAAQYQDWVTSYSANYIGPVTDIKIGRMRVANVIVPTPGSVTEQVTSEVNRALNRLMKRNKLNLQLREFVQYACVLGKALIMVWEDQDAPADNPLAEVTIEDPRQWLLTPDPERKLLNLRATRVWDRPDLKITRLNVFYKNTLERYWCQQGEGGKPEHWHRWVRGLETRLIRDDTGKFLVPTIADDEWDTANELGRIPVFEADLGECVHERGWKVQDALDKLLGGVMLLMEFAGQPMYAALKNSEDINRAAAASFGTGRRDAVTRSGKPAPRSVPRSRIRPNTILEIAANQLIKITTESPDGFIGLYKHLVEVLASVTTTPVDDLLQPKGGFPSGPARRASLIRLTEQLKDISMNLEAVIEDALTYALEVEQVAVASDDDTEVDISWYPIEPVDLTDRWSVVLQQQAAGVPISKTLLEAGYDPAEVESWEQERDLQQTIDDIFAFADAAAGIRAAVQGGEITEAEVEAAMQELLAGVPGLPGLSDTAALGAMPTGLLAAGTPAIAPAVTTPGK